MGDGPADLDEDGLDAAVAAPVGEDGQLDRVDFAVGLRDKGEVDPGDELDRRWSIWVLFAAENLQRVDAVLVYGLGVFCFFGWGGARPKKKVESSEAVRGAVFIGTFVSVSIIRSMVGKGQ